jgi:uncharacterized protein YndB with AHSA1/START domain
MTKQTNARDFHMAAAAMKRPKAVADGAAGTLLASAEVAAPPERAFAALMTGEVERWWKLPGVFRLKDWRRTFVRKAAGASASRSTTGGGSTNGARSARLKRRIALC